MAKFTLPTPPPFRPPVADVNEVAGEDVRFTDSLTILSGDWMTLKGSDVTEQSVRREASSNAGAMLRRQEWGMGVTHYLFKGATRSNNDAMISRVRSRMRANPRVGRFISAELISLPLGQGQAVVIRYEPVGVKAPITTRIKS